MRRLGKALSFLASEVSFCLRLRGDLPRGNELSSRNGSSLTTNNLGRALFLS